MLVIDVSQPSVARILDLPRRSAPPLHETRRLFQHSRSAAGRDRDSHLESDCITLDMEFDPMITTGKSQGAQWHRCCQRVYGVSQSSGYASSSCGHPPPSLPPSDHASQTPALAATECAKVLVDRASVGLCAASWSVLAFHGALPNSRSSETAARNLINPSKITQP